MIDAPTCEGGQRSVLLSRIIGERMLLRRSLPILLIAAASLWLAACGSEGNSVTGQSAAIESGSQLFAARCSGCHTLSAVGAEGSAAKVSTAQKTNGPNFNKRKECYDNVLYALRNGGFSGAIMPANIVVGKESEQVAAFLAKYAGSDAMNSTTKCAATPANAGG